MKRRLRDQFSSQIGVPPVLSRSSAAPKPLLAPRAKAAPTPLGDGKLRFSFLGRDIDLDTTAMDWLAPGPGAQNQLWRMNLHYMEYLESVDDALWSKLVESWIDGNGAGGPGTWRDSWNSYALSLRVVVWLQELARRGERLSDALVVKVEESTARQLKYLEDNLETDLGGNHLIKNIKALIWAGSYFQGQAADRWREKGLALLARELDKQILPDGVHYERSPSYHAQVFADLLECRVALGADPLDGALDHALSRMAQATADLTHPDGYAAQFNDAGLTMAYPPSECLEAYANLGFEGHEARAQFSFPDAGYFGTRAGDNYFVCDCGPIAPDDLPAHGHGDVLSFEWSVGGHRIFVDQGVYEYVEGPRRMASRSAAHHNTLCLEGADQADFFGAFRCGRRPATKLTSVTRRETGMVVEGLHDGFSHLPGHPVHRRRFEITDGAIEIVDWLEPASDLPAAISVLLHPDITAARDGNVIRLVAGGIEIALNSTQAVAVTQAVWWPDMGQEIKTTRLTMTLDSGVKNCRTSFRVIQAGPHTLEDKP